MGKAKMGFVNTAINTNDDENSHNVVPSSSAPQEQDGNINQLKRFRYHCKIYYQKSLSISDNDDDSQEEEEEEHDDNNSIDDVQASKAVLDAFEQAQQTIVTTAANDAITTIAQNAFLKTGGQKNANNKKYADVLNECGLLLHVDNSIDKTNNSQEEEKVPELMFPPVSPYDDEDEENGGAGNSSAEDGEDGFGGTAESRQQKQQQQQKQKQQQQWLLLEEYTKIKNEERRNAHKLEMEYRQNKLRKLLLERRSSSPKEEEVKDKDGDGSESQQQLLGDWDVTSRKYLIHVRSLLKKFVQQYHSTKIGSHSLLGGIRKLIEKQVQSTTETEISVWKFNALILSESCIATTTSPNNEDGGGDTYMRDAVDVLTSFMIYMRSVDEEGGDVEEDIVPQRTQKEGEEELFVSFYIHPTISDAVLESFLRELPSYTELDARPTGNIITMIVVDDDAVAEEEEENNINNNLLLSASAAIKKRINRNGNMDEPVNGISDYLVNECGFCYIL